jgi:hypothetical protein
MKFVELEGRLQSSLSPSWFRCVILT